MKFTNLIGKQLKDDDVLSLLEDFDVEVVYDLDRTHENLPDLYWAAFKEQGFLLRFDASQKLDVVFIFRVSAEGYTPIMPETIEGIPLFQSRDEVDPVKFGFPCVLVRGEVPKKNGVTNLWARVDGADISIHFSFIDGIPSKVSVFSRNRQ